MVNWRRWRRGKVEDGMTHRYVGPTTVFGLNAGARCRPTAGGRRRGGLVPITTGDGKRWKVPAQQVESLR
jgi:hypothetical protein